MGWQGKMKGDAETGFAIFTSLDDKQIVLQVAKIKSRDDTADKG